MLGSGFFSGSIFYQGLKNTRKKPEKIIGEARWTLSENVQKVVREAPGRVREVFCLSGNSSKTSQGLVRKSPNKIGKRPKKSEKLLLANGHWPMANGVWLKKFVFLDFRDFQGIICGKNDFTSPMRRAAKFCVGAWPNRDLASVLDPIREGPGLFGQTGGVASSQVPRLRSQTEKLEFSSGSSGSSRIQRKRWQQLQARPPSHTRRGPG